MNEVGYGNATDLYKAVEHQDWKRATKILRENPTDAAVWVYKLEADGITLRWKVLPLHQAAARDPPPSVMYAFLAAYPDGVKCRNGAAGNLPVHYAVQWGSSVEIVKMLLVAYPDCLLEKDSRGLTLSEIARRTNNPNSTEVLEAVEKGAQHYKPVVIEKTEKEESDSAAVQTFEAETALEKSMPDMVAMRGERPATHVSEEAWHQEGLAIIVIGASGDLAKKKTYPSLLSLFDSHLLPDNVKIYGYARSSITHDELREKLRPFLSKGGYSSEVVEDFLSRCYYQAGTSYGDVNSWKGLNEILLAREKELENEEAQKVFNRLFYFAIPPNVFAETGEAIKTACMAPSGFSRMIVEKPFGRDLESCKEILGRLGKHFDETNLFRIDHYLGKEMVQNLLVLRFGNAMFEPLWNRDDIQCIFFTFKEPFGTDGRGGYFDQYGIIRDIIQNHLLQCMCLLMMECPTQLDGPEAGEKIRDEKVRVLEAMEEITIDNVFTGQYDGYKDDPTIKDKNTVCPTYALIRCFINNPRWQGVPIIFKAGKALNERKAEMRIQFKDAPAAEFLFSGECPRNELIMKLQPEEAIYLKSNIKTPGFSSEPIQSELEMNYDSRFFNGGEEKNPDAYSRLILDVLRGRSAAFVRSDELIRSWEVFTPVLNQIQTDMLKPFPYKQGSRGPDAADKWVEEMSGYKRNNAYRYIDGDVLEVKSESETVGDCEVGLYGLAVMGQNFALNMASHGFKVCVGNRSEPKIKLTVDRAKAEGNLPLVGSTGPEDFIKKLSKPRKVIILVMAGKPVDDTIAELVKYMEPGDIIVDGGNEWYLNTLRRSNELESKNILFIGMGISGGEEGARNGPSLMPGGPKEAFDAFEKILTSCAAQVNDGACTGYVGPIGSGNYVKMVHNGVEYGDMQLICEAYDLMKHVGKMTNKEMAAVFDTWNKGRLESYLIEITALILAKDDEITGIGQVVDYVLDKTGMKGTGRWTVQEAAEMSVAAPTMAASLDARYISARKSERVLAETILKGPSHINTVDKNKLISDLECALYASKVCSYAQGCGLIKAASEARGWDVDLKLCAKLWKGGCIIRAALLQKIQDAFTRDEGLKNLMTDPLFAAELNDAGKGWRGAVSTALTNGIACPSMTCSLTYFDSYRRESLPANLTQAQRDFFGGHTYERNDKEGIFHTAWTDAHKSIGDINERKAGEI